MLSFKSFLPVLAILLVCFVGSSAFAQECYTDPATGRQFCPLKKVAAATGHVLQAAANAVTPNEFALPMQSGQHYGHSSVTYSHGHRSVTLVKGQPVRNLVKSIGSALRR